MFQRLATTSRCILVISQCTLQRGQILRVCTIHVFVNCNLLEIIQLCRSLILWESCYVTFFANYQCIVYHSVYNSLCKLEIIKIMCQILWCSVLFLFCLGLLRLIRAFQLFECTLWRDNILWQLFKLLFNVQTFHLIHVERKEFVQNLYIHIYMYIICLANISQLISSVDFFALSSLLSYFVERKCFSDYKSHML